MTRRALVLGCGGVAGAAWTTAALQNLQTHLDWDVRNAEIIVGTSAGAVLGALISAGVSVQALANCQAGQPKAVCFWDHDSSSGGALPPLPRPALTNWRLAVRGLTAGLDPMVAACGLMPRGGFDMEPFRKLIDSVVPDGQWTPHPNLWLVTVNTTTGERVAFGKQGAPASALNDAVCASYGVPGWCPPVEIAGSEYMDGGVASPTSADLLVDAPVDEVIVLAPMASSQLNSSPSLPQRVEQLLRKRMTRIVDREVDLLEKAGKKVIRMEPGPADLKAIGYNMMDPQRRLQFYQTALETTRL